MILNKAVSMAIVASPLAVVGINMDVPSFTAGMMFALPAYICGRVALKDEIQTSYWLGMGMALFGSFATAMAPNLIPLDAPIQFKMISVAFGFPLLILWLKNKGKKWSNGDDKNS
jgi:hypothetical protein